MSMLGDIPGPESASSSANPPEQPAPAPKEPMMAGTFALYEHESGGIVLVTDIAGRGVETKMIPAMIVKMVQGGGGPMGATLRKMFGAGGE